MQRARLDGFGGQKPVAYLSDLPILVVARGLDEISTRADSSRRLSQVRNS